MKSILPIIFSFLLSHNIFAQDGLSFSLGSFKIGEKRLDIDLREFKINHERSNSGVKTGIIRNSTQWIREKGNILSPKALILISYDLDDESENFTIKYEDQILLAQGQKNKSSIVYVDLFNPSPIEVLKGGKLIDKINFKLESTVKNRMGHLIDYSCAQYKIEVEGLDDEYLTLGCITEKLGRIGSERNRVILTLKVNQHYLKSHRTSPYYSILMNETPIHTNFVDNNEKSHKVVIRTKFPRRSHRLKAAIGLGPYALNAHQADRNINYNIAPAAMLYMKWDLTNESSLRIFEALIKRTSLFSNAGVYFAYDLARAFDDKVQIVPLLGAQILTYKFDKDSKTTNKVIYPQGFEASFKHAFGIKNFNFTYGMFLSTQSKETYNNIWLRWGRGYFWELNYIKWAREELSAETYGLSIGIPIGQFF